MHYLSKDAARKRMERLESDLQGLLKGQSFNDEATLAKYIRCLEKNGKLRGWYAPWKHEGEGKPLATGYTFAGHPFYPDIQLELKVEGAAGKPFPVVGEIKLLKNHKQALQKVSQAIGQALIYRTIIGQPYACAVVACNNTGVRKDAGVLKVKEHAWTTGVYLMIIELR